MINKTYLNLKSLITKKYYKDMDMVMSYLDLFLMLSRLTQDEYMELALYAGDQYSTVTPETSADQATN